MFLEIALETRRHRGWNVFWKLRCGHRGPFLHSLIPLGEQHQALRPLTTKLEELSYRPFWNPACADRTLSLNKNIQELPYPVIGSC